MSEVREHTDRYTPCPAHEVPKTRTNLLSILRHYDDDPNQLTPDQMAAARRLFFLDDDRTVQELIRDGEVEP